MSRWWYLDLMADYPELEIYQGHGWGPVQELGLIELGERAMEEETFWLPTWFYSEEAARTWAAVSRLLAMVCDRIRRERPEAEQVIRVLAGTAETVLWEEIPVGWLPGAAREALSGDYWPAD